MNLEIYDTTDSIFVEKENQTKVNHFILNKFHKTRDGGDRSHNYKLVIFATPSFFPSLIPLFRISNLI
jgi:hypothetical protein